MRYYFKWFLGAIFFYSRFLHLIRLWNNLVGKRLTILMFHRVTDNNSSEDASLPTICVSLDNFESLLKFIRKHYKVISANDYLKCLKNEFRVPNNALVLSFDDGYTETLENALPILQKYQLPAVLFIPTAMIDHAGSFWWDQIYTILQNTKNCVVTKRSSPDPMISRYLPRINRILSKQPEDRRPAIIEFIEALQDSRAEVRNGIVQFLLHDSPIMKPNQTQPRAVLNWDQIRYLNSCGIEIGSHTVNHQFLPTVSNEEAMAELRCSKSKLEEQIESRVACFSYPGGKYDDDILKLVQEAGYSCAFTTEEGVNSLTCHHYKLKRINISDEEVLNPRNRFSKSISALGLFLKW